MSSCVTVQVLHSTEASKTQKGRINKVTGLKGRRHELSYKGLTHIRLWKHTSPKYVPSRKVLHITRYETTSRTPMFRAPFFSNLAYNICHVSSKFRKRCLIFDPHALADVTSDLAKPCDGVFGIRAVSEQLPGEYVPVHETSRAWALSGLSRKVLPGSTIGGMMRHYNHKKAHH